MTRVIYIFKEGEAPIGAYTEELGIALERFLNRKHSLTNTTFKFRPEHRDITVELSKADDELQAFLFGVEAECFLKGYAEGGHDSGHGPRPTNEAMLAGDKPKEDPSYEHNFYSGMALVKHDERYEIVEMGKVLEDVKAQYPDGPPYMYRELLLDETPREFRLNVEHIMKQINPDALQVHIQDLAAKGTEYFADRKEVFARVGPGICMHVCSCQTEQGARIAAGIMEWLRYFSDELGNGSEQ